MKTIVNKIALKVTQNRGRPFNVFFSLVMSLVQWSPLNGITLGPRRTNSINRMIPLTDTHIALPSPNRPWIP
jgi:hypothetical protein